MAKLFNIAGPCNPVDHYMMPAMARLPEVVGLLKNKSYFVLHAQRQCGKTTAMLALAKEINKRGEAVALYISLESVQAFPKAEEAMPMIANLIRRMSRVPGTPFEGLQPDQMEREVNDDTTNTCIYSLLNYLAQKAGKPLFVFFDEADCLSGTTVITFLRQLRNGAISLTKGVDFPASIALVGMRDIRDYKARIRPDSETLGSASPFNIVTEALSLRIFTKEEIRSLYAQHTADTGQRFTDEAVDKAWEYTQGQPYLVNAIARWCVEKIHQNRYDEIITGEEVHEAKEKIIRERGTHLDSLMERMKEPRLRPIVEQVMLGGDVDYDEYENDLKYAVDLGLFRDERGGLVPANPMYAEIMGRYISYGNQRKVMREVPETPWVKDNGLDMQGLLAAFQEFWRENADENAVPYQYREAYPQIVLQAFLQRVINGGGEIIREMALGKKAMDLGVLFRGAKYAVEVKKLAYYEKSHEKAYKQVTGYMDRLGVAEGWLVVFDPDLTKPWEDRLSSEDMEFEGKTIHLVRC